MTLVVVKRLKAGEKPRRGRTAGRSPFPADLNAIDRIRGFIRDRLAGLGLDEQDRLKIELALHEICVNVALYAYPRDEGR